MTFIAEDRVFVKATEYVPEQFHNATATVVATIDEWLHNKYGDNPGSPAEYAARYAYAVTGVDTVIKVDNFEREIAINSEDLELLKENEEVQALEELFKL